VSAGPTEAPRGPSTTAALESGEPCGDNPADLDAAEFAFIGTVTDVQPGKPASVRWVTFAVDGWYTTKQGPEFHIFMPGYRVAVGETLAVAGNAHLASARGFSGKSGTAEFCAPANDQSSPAFAAWDARFGPIIKPDQMLPLGTPDPADLAAIDAAEQAWRGARPDSYSYWLSQYPTSCSFLNGRVVVRNGVVADFIAPDGGPIACDLDQLKDPVTVAFQRARDLAGAESFTFSSDLAAGVILNFSALDRVIDAGASIHHFSESTAPLITGWEDVSRAADAARSRWAQVPDNRTTRIETGGGERNAHQVVTTEAGGEVRSITDNGQAVNAADLPQPWTPYTVGGVFKLIDQLAGEGGVEAVFDETTGAPVEVHFDPVVNGDDDEIDVYVTVTFEP